jgi:hypothetical protein
LAWLGRQRILLSIFPTAIEPIPNWQVISGKLLSSNSAINCRGNFMDILQPYATLIAMDIIFLMVVHAIISWNIFFEIYDRYRLRRKFK